MGTLGKQFKRFTRGLGRLKTPPRILSPEEKIATIPQLQLEFHALKQQSRQNYNKFLRASAKLERYKKRAEERNRYLKEYGNEQLMREIIPFVDNLERAIRHGRAENNGEPEAFIEGIRLAINEVKRLYKRHGFQATKTREGRMDVKPRGADKEEARSLGPVDKSPPVVSAVSRDRGDTSELQQGPKRNGGVEGIIAVGGAKGGVGKTVFAVNLAVSLAEKGKRVVAADLDLGGSDLHLCMGLKGLRQTLNDFLCNKELSLSNVVVPTGMKNLSIIGGNNSLLGTANLQFSQKLKLIRALRKLDADIVVLDLGGDTSFNVLDFYLQADLPLVVTSTEPTSYLDAYNFIKVGLLRRLSRYNGPEYRVRDRLPYPVQTVLREAVDWQADRSISTIIKLLDEIEQIDQESRARLEGILLVYRPCLVFNMVRKEKQCQLIYNRLRETGDKMLGVSIDEFHMIPEDERMRQSVRTLQPLLTLDRESPSAAAIAQIGRHVLQTLPERTQPE
jgi:flagellar biosynthesis protein FlhG